MKQPSQLLFDLLKSFESCKLTAYDDGTGHFTIGYGSAYLPNGSRIKEGDTCTLEQAQEYLIFHLRGLIDHLNATIPDSLAQGQFDALLDFCYNAGEGAWNSSSLKVSVNSDPLNFNKITADFKKWDKVHRYGIFIVSRGLLRRRKCEAYLYKNGVNAPNFLA